VKIIAQEMGFVIQKLVNVIAIQDLQAKHVDLVKIKRANHGVMHIKVSVL